LRSWPSLFNLADVESVGIAARRQEGAVEIALHGLRPTVTKHMRPLRERLFHVFADRVIELRQPGFPRIDLDNCPASAFSLAAQFRDKHPRRAHFHAAAEILLEGSVAERLRLDRVALAENAVGELPVRPLAALREAALDLGLLALPAFVARGASPAFRALPDRAVGVVIIAVGGAARAVQGALQAPDLLPWLFDFGTKLFEDRVVARDGGDGRRADVEPDDAIRPRAQSGASPCCTSWQNQRGRPLMTRRTKRTYFVGSDSVAACQPRLSLRSSSSGRARPA
jgi:hypothetical protein